MCYSYGFGERPLHAHSQIYSKTCSGGQMDKIYNFFYLHNSIWRWISSVCSPLLCLFFILSPSFIQIERDSVHSLHIAIVKILFIAKSQSLVMCSVVLLFSSSHHFLRLFFFYTSLFFSMFSFTCAGDRSAVIFYVSSMF